MTQRVEVVRITPELAFEWLANNPENRNLVKSHWQKLSEVMRRGEFVDLNGELIKKTSDGVIIDGQHRLTACFESGVSFTTYVLFNAPREIQSSVDQGLRRTFANILQWRGEKNAARLASSLRILYHFWETGEIRTQGMARAMSNGALIEFLDHHNELRESLNPIHRDEIGRLLTPSVYVSLDFLFTKVDAEECELFFDKVCTGADLSPRDPILALRNNLLSVSEKVHKQMTSRHKAALTITSFNYWRLGREISQVTFKPTVQLFPEIMDFPYDALNCARPSK